MSNFTTFFLGIKDILVDSIQELSNEIHVAVSTLPSNPCCPCCNKPATRIHDYRYQRVKDLPYRNKYVVLMLKKRRYRCSCGKRFFEKYSFLPRYHHMTRRVYESIIHELRQIQTFKSVSLRFGVSATTTARVFGIVKYTLYKLPETLAIDEFKGNAGGEKYQAIITDPKKHKLLDIMPSREKASLFQYFDQFPNRKHVKTFIMDMWEPYKHLAQYFFPNAMIVIDKYHYVRQVYWAMNNVRKRVQQRLYKEKRKYFKRFRWLLDTDYTKLNDENKQALMVILNHDTDLYNAWQLKEMFIDFRDEPDPSKAEQLLRRFILMAEEINLPEYQAAVTAFHNWFPYIINSKRTPFTNAFTEGTNNKVKVVKRIAYGFRNFERFRTKILHCS